MIRTLLLAMALLCCSMWAIAQTSQDQSGSKTSDNPAGEMKPSSRQMTIEGCLATSGDNYMITDSAGTRYRLTGSTSNLRSHVNEQVKVTGTGVGTGTQGTGTATTTETTETFHVAKVTKISDSCTSKSK